METKTEGDSFAATNLESDAETCIHCGQTRSGHTLIGATCRKAGFYGNRFDPAPATRAEIVPDHEVRWGVRWPSLHPAPEGHTDRWYASEDEAWAVRNTTRGDAYVIRQTITLGPVEVVQ